MKAVILAAGYATRLYPLTVNKPKPLLKIAGKPVINYIIEKLESLKEINQVFVITNNKFYNHFLNWKNTLKTNLKIKIVNDNTTTNENKLGAIGDINFVIQKENINEDLMIISGDNLFDFNLTEIYNFFNKKKLNTIALIERNIEIAKRSGVVILDKNNKIINFEEKPQQPKSNLCSISPYFYNANTIKKFKEYIDKKNNPDAPGFFLEWLHKIEDVYGFKLNGKWFDIGNKEQLEKANKTYKNAIPT